MHIDEIEKLFEQKRVTSLHQDVIYLLMEIYRAGKAWLEDEDEAQPLIDAINELIDL